MTTATRLPVQRMQRAMPVAPHSYTGTIAAFVDDVMLPLLPSPQAVEAFHGALVHYLEQPNAGFNVRHVADQDRRATGHTVAGDPVLAGDNASPWWNHALLFHDAWPDAPFGAVLHALPRHFHDAGGIQHCNAAGWHLAHLLDAKDGDTDWRAWDRRELTRRMVRNLHPCNHFFVPMTDWRRVGADDDVQGYVAWVFRRRYRAVWAEFLTLAGDPSPRPRQSAGTLALSIREAAPSGTKHRTNSTGRTVAAMHFVCRDDLNVTDRGDGTFETGVWKVDLKHAATVETVALHTSKDRRSHRQGRVIDWHTVDHEGHQRVVFVVKQAGGPLRWSGKGSGEKGYRWVAPAAAPS